MAGTGFLMANTSKIGITKEQEAAIIAQHTAIRAKHTTIRENNMANTSKTGITKEQAAAIRAKCTIDFKKASDTEINAWFEGLIVKPSAVVIDGKSVEIKTTTQKREYLISANLSH